MKKLLSVGVLCLTLCFAFSCTKNENSPEPSQSNTKKVRGNKSGNDLSWAVDLLTNDSNFQLFTQKFSEINNEINIHMASLTPAQRSAAIASIRQDGSPENVALNWGYTLSKEYEMYQLYERVINNNPSLLTIEFPDMEEVMNQALMSAPYLTYPCLSSSCCWNNYHNWVGHANTLVNKQVWTQSQASLFIKEQQTRTNNCLDDAIW
jgi:hypothetical protein